MERLEVLLLGGGSDDPFVVEAPLGSTDAELAPLIAAELGLAPSAKLCLPSPRPSSGPWHVSQGAAHCAPAGAAGAASGGSAESAEMLALRRRIASLLAENEALKQQQQQQPASSPMMPMQSPDKAAGPTPSASRANAASPSGAAPSEAMMSPSAPSASSSAASSSHSPLDVDVRPLVRGAVGVARSLASLVAGRFAVLDFWTTK